MLLDLSLFVVCLPSWDSNFPIDATRLWLLEYRLSQSWYTNTYFFKKSIYFGAVLGLFCYSGAFSTCSDQGLPFLVVCGLLIVVASLVAEHGL